VSPCDEKQISARFQRGCAAREIHRNSTCGEQGLLDNAFREATSKRSSWLQSDYKLSTSEAAIVLGPGVEYTVSEVADQNLGLVAKIRKGALVSSSPAK
jgi:hypothetical protein